MAKWSDSTEIPNQTSKTGPSLAVFDNRLHMVHLGNSSDDIWHSEFDGVKWTPNVRIGLKSRGIVAFASSPSDSLAGGLLVYRSVNQAPDGSYPLMYSQYNPFGGFGFETRLPGNFTSDHSPAVVYVNNRWMVVRVVAHGTAMRSARYSTTRTLALVDDSPIANQTTKTGVALETYAGNLHLLHLGSGSNNIWHSLFQWPQDTFGPNVRIPDQASQDTPSMAVFRNILHMVHRGSGSDNIWHSTYEFNWTPNVRVPGQTSSSRPALAATSDALHLVHKGAGSNRLWHCTYR
jgi:hypothetical protein